MRSHPSLPRPVSSIPRTSTAVPRPLAMLAIGALTLGLSGSGLMLASSPQAAAASATGAAQGSYTDVLQSPEEIDFSAAPAEVAEVDAETWSSPKVGAAESPFQAFELDHPGQFSPVSWTGTVDPSRQVALLAWNHAEERWDQLRSATGSAPEATVLEAHVSEDYRDADGKAHIAVTGEDPFLSGEEDWAPDPFGVTGDFADPADYDFSIAHVTDTQFLSEGAVDPDLDPAARERFASAYRDQMNWIVDNAEERTISYVAHTGDVIENWLLPHHPEEQARAEFEFASQMQSIIDEAGIPNGITPGNHDNGWGLLGNDLYNDYFPAERYEEASESWEDASYGGPWREGDNSAHYDLFEVDGHEFIAVYLPYSHNTAQRSWANEVLSAFPDRDAFLFTHAYLRASGNEDASKAGGNIGYGDNGHLLRTQVVEQNDNLVMVSSGHYHGTTWNHNRNGDAGPVFEMLGDYQNYEVDGERSTGFLRMLQFDVDASEVKVNTYSPRLDQFGATEYDPEGRYQPETDEYTAPLSLSSRGTTLVTDQIHIGEAEESLEEGDVPEDQEPTPVEPPAEEEPEQPSEDLVLAQQDDLTATSGQEIDPITLDVSDEEAALEFAGLPEGLMGVSDDREITGTPQETGEFEVTVTAADRFGREESMAFTLTVSAPAGAGEDENGDDDEQDTEQPVAPGEDDEGTDGDDGSAGGGSGDSGQDQPARGDAPAGDVAVGATGGARTAPSGTATGDSASGSSSSGSGSGSGSGNELARTGTDAALPLALGALTLTGLGIGALVLRHRHARS